MFKKILVPLDGSEIAGGILPIVEELASSLNLEIILLRVAFAHTIPGIDRIDAEVKAV